MENSYGLLFRLSLSRAKTEGRGFHPRPQTHNEAVRGCGMSIRHVLWTQDFVQAEYGIRDVVVTGVQACDLPISVPSWHAIKKDGTVGHSYSPSRVTGFI